MTSEVDDRCSGKVMEYLRDCGQRCKRGVSKSNEGVTWYVALNDPELTQSDG